MRKVCENSRAGSCDRVTIRMSWNFLNTFFVSSHMYPENSEGTQVIVGSMNMGFILHYCQESNSQSVPSQAGADTTRPQ